MSSPISSGPSRSSRWRTCDICRQRKAKCTMDTSSSSNTATTSPSDQRPCEGCVRIGAECTFNMGYKKPGRPNNWANRTWQQTDVHTFKPSHHRHRLSSEESYATSNTHRRRSSTSPSRGRNAEAGPSTLPSDRSPYTHDLLTAALDEYGSSTITSPLLEMTNGVQYQLSETSKQPPPDYTAQAANMQPPTSIISAKPILTPFQQYLVQVPQADIQIEAVASWATIGFFLSLYLKYMHSLIPLVHKPTFTKLLAMRVDKGDPQFRAFLLGLVAYTIGQSPITRMEQFMSRPDLIRLQSDCHRASMMLLNGRYKEPSLVRIGSLITGYFYCATVGRSVKAATLLAEACHLVHIMQLHDDAVTLSMGLDHCEVDLRRRVFWHVYAVDITEASAGGPIHLQIYEGLPPYPLEVDDELITTQGSFPQPPAETSYMTGFTRCVSLFPIMAECLVRMRSLRHCGSSLTEDERKEAREWVEKSALDVDTTMAKLPPVLQQSNTVEEGDDEQMGVFGMQRANLLITAASVRFALYDYHAAVDPHADIEAERDASSRRVLQTLATIPLNSLAANGESMRGKVFRIILALISQDGALDAWGETLNDWWNMYSAIQFVQLVTLHVDSNIPSREGSPGRMLG